MSDDLSVQDLHLGLISKISFNDFDGKTVAEGLRSHRELWVSVVSSHTSGGFHHPAHRLFEELVDDAWFADTLWMFAVNNDAASKLVKLLKEEWNADEVYVYTRKQAETDLRTTLVDDEVLIQAWWD